MLGVSYAAPRLMSSVSTRRVSCPLDWPPLPRFGTELGRISYLTDRLNTLALRDPHVPSQAPSRLPGGGVLGLVDELSNFRPLLLQVGQVLFANLLIYLELFLRQVLLPCAHIGLPKAIVGVSKIGVKFKRQKVFRHGLGIFALVGVEI